MKTKAYAKSLRESIDYNRYASLIASVGDQLNDRKDRFDKSTIIERSLEVYSNCRLEFVDDIGRDHFDHETKMDLEFKYTENGIFTPKKKPKKVVKVKLKNSLGEHKGTSIKDPADYYLIGQQDSIAIISWPDIKPFLHAVPDGIEAHIPFQKLTFIFSPEDVDVQPNLDVDYKKIKADAQLRLIESV